jgi:hypothetical protein
MKHVHLKTVDAQESMVSPLSRLKTHPRPEHTVLTYLENYILSLMLQEFNKLNLIILKVVRPNYKTPLMIIDN